MIYEQVIGPVKVDVTAPAFHCSVILQYDETMNKLYSEWNMSCYDEIDIQEEAIYETLFSIGKYWIV